MADFYLVPPPGMHMGGCFFIGQVEGADDYRLAAFIDETETTAKWLAPDGQDLAFTRAELRELRDLLGRVLAALEVTQEPRKDA